jgi:hypothetical protein
MRIVVVTSLALVLAGCASSPDINGMITNVFSSGPTAAPPPVDPIPPPPPMMSPAPPRPAVVASNKPKKKCGKGETLSKGKCVRRTAPPPGQGEPPPANPT